MAGEVGESSGDGQGQRERVRVIGAWEIEGNLGMCKLIGLYRLGRELLAGTQAHISTYWPQTVKWHMSLQTKIHRQPLEKGKDSGL